MYNYIYITCLHFADLVCSWIVPLPAVFVSLPDCGFNKRSELHLHSVGSLCEPDTTNHVNTCILRDL